LVRWFRPWLNRGRKSRPRPSGEARPRLRFAAAPVDQRRVEVGGHLTVPERRSTFPACHPARLMPPTHSRTESSITPLRSDQAADGILRSGPSVDGRSRASWRAVLATGATRSSHGTVAPEASFSWLLPPLTRA
jgi:hypothetical protein